MSSLCLKSAFVSLLVFPWFGTALSDDTSYQAEVAATQNRYLALANRKAMGGSLSPAEEQQRLCLLGELIDRNPVWALTRDITADYQAISSGKRPSAEESATAEKLLQLIQITTSFEHRATTLSEANAFATILRQFVVRRDVDGAKAWVKAQ